jgi:serine/threonine protein kinase
MDNSPERERALLEAALRLPAEQRAAFVAVSCSTDEALRQRLEARLLEQPQAPGPPGDTTLTAPGRVLAPGPEFDEQPGDRIGRYQLLQVIGQGGMGSVWMAEQTEPIRRKVALKVVKAGLDSNQVLARFEAERQVLALMDHPNIAKVLDAGSAPRGRPYFVMELVNGTPLTTFCDEEGLSLRQRLELFVSICQAAQHAHQKGIIHRDMKPSNVLVATYDGRAVPKIIDFGVAKATGQSTADRTTFTQFGAVIGTLEYMSPEQAQLNQLDIDTRSDIYSLGVLLYELLTGTTPLVHETIREAAFDEVLRRIREEEPPCPSTRLTRQLAAVQPDARGKSKIKSQKSKIAADLDWIVMKALEKERARRYETANGLAMDLQRYLNDEPVVARPPTGVYRFRKLVRRHRLAFGAAAAVALSLLAGLAASTSLWLKEKDARKRADDEATKSHEVAGFLKAMLSGVDPSVAQGRDTSVLREILDKAAAQVRQELKQRPEIQAELFGTIGHTYCALGVYDKAEAIQREALALLTKKPGPESAEYAEALNLLATTLYRAGKLPEAESFAGRALELRRKIFPADRAPIAESLNDLSLILLDQDRLPEAECLQSEALALSRKLLGDDHPNVASSLNNLASMLSAEGKFEEAEKMQREELALTRKRLGPLDPELAISLNNLALLLCDEHKLPEAEDYARQALDLRRKILPPEHPDLAVSLNALGRILSDQNKLADAEFLVQQALTIRLKLTNADPLELAISLEDLSVIRQRQGRTAEGLPLAGEALVIREKQAPDSWATFRARSSLGGLFLDQQQLTNAEPLLVSGFEGMKRLQKGMLFDQRSALTNGAWRLVQLYKAMGQKEKAAGYAKELQPARTGRDVSPAPRPGAK